MEVKVVVMIANTPSVQLATPGRSQVILHNYALIYYFMAIFKKTNWDEINKIYLYKRIASLHIFYLQKKYSKEQL